MLAALLLILQRCGGHVFLPEMLVSDGARAMQRASNGNTGGTSDTTRAIEILRRSYHGKDADQANMHAD